jgi:hypothetical protein
MRGPAEFAAYLNKELYHPRSNAHSNALCMGILIDLLDLCEKLRERASRGEIVANLNHNVTVRGDNWNIDLAMGPSESGAAAIDERHGIALEPPALVEIAIEVKGVMTEHGKARRNRLRDMKAFARHSFDYNPATIAVGAIVVNAAPVFWSPTRPAGDITTHKNIARVVEKTLDILRNAPLRNSTQQAGLDAFSAVVVRHDNLLKNVDRPVDTVSPGESKLVTKPPAPQIGDPLHYSTMIHQMCRMYQARW